MGRLFKVKTDLFDILLLKFNEKTSEKVNFEIPGNRRLIPMKFSEQLARGILSLSLWLSESVEPISDECDLNFSGRWNIV